MSTLVPILLSLAPYMASAAVNLDAVGAIERTYDPKIEIRSEGTSWSFYGCKIEEIRIMGRDPVTSLERAVTVSFYRAPVKNQRAVIILPPTGGVNILDQGYANELCSSGISAALVSGWEHQNYTSLEYRMHNDGALRALAASRHVMEFLQHNGFNSVGILGTSIGAISGALVLGFEPRISSAALIVGSARFADVIADSDETGAALLRKNRIKSFGLKSAEEYKQAVRNNVWVEPSEFIDRFEKKSAFIVSADADKTVKTQYQLELAERLNAKHHLRLRGDHVRAIKDTFFYHRGKIAKFFLNTL